MKLFDLDEFLESGGDVSEQDREGEESVKRAEHDIHADDIDIFVEEDGTDEEKEDGRAKFWMHVPTPITELEARII